MTTYMLAGGLLASCLAADVPMELPPPGERQLFRAEMGRQYGQQIFFELATGQATIRDRESWDLGFSCDPDNHYVILNGAKRMLAAPAEGPFEAVTSRAGLTFEPDHPHGEGSRTRLGRWWDDPPADHDPVFVIDRGQFVSGFPIGTKKISLRRTPEGYWLRHANLNGQQADSLLIVKDSTFNFVFFSFNEGGQVVPVEPPKDRWDLAFTSYVHFFEEQTDPSFRFYLVTGVNHNRHRVTATDSLMERVRPFAEINLADVDNFTFHTRIDVIGYEWKFFDLPNNRFTVFDDRYYLVRSVGGPYYKMRFLSFFNEAGERGYPLIEYQRL